MWQLYIYLFQFIKYTQNMKTNRFQYSTLALVLLSLPNYANSETQQKAKETMVVKASALKVDTPAQEMTQSVSVVTQEDLKNRAPVKFDEALRYTAGVQAQQYGADNDTDWALVRGFEARTYLDGSRTFKDGHYTWINESYGLERIEILRGSAAILYGEAPPGGVINAVQKKPTVVPQGEVKLQLGNHNHQSVGFDVSDKANEDGSVRFRLVGMFKRRNGELNGAKNDRFYLAPSVAIDVSDKTQLTFMSTILHDDGVPTNGFFPAYGTIIDAPNGKIDPSTNLGEPGYDKYKRTQVSVGYNLEHEINDTWNFTQRFNYAYNKLFLKSTYAFPNYGPSETVNRGVVYRDGDVSSFTLDNRAVAKWDSDRVENTLLMGVDLQHHKNVGIEKSPKAAPINPWKPIYGNYPVNDPKNDVNRRINMSQASLYAQYQFKLDYKWIGILGGRYDMVKRENRGYGVNTNEYHSRNDNELSLNAGLMYQADNGMSPYISYSESFEASGSLDWRTKQLLKPVRGQQAELGVKYTPYFMDGFVNIAMFDIKQKNPFVLGQGPKATQSGEATLEVLRLKLSVTLPMRSNCQRTIPTQTTKPHKTVKPLNLRLSLLTLPRHG